MIGARLCLSGDCSELEWAGSGELDLLAASELISMLEHEGSDSSGLAPALSDASRTEYLEDEKAPGSSARHLAGLSRSMLWIVLR